MLLYDIFYPDNSFDRAVRLPIHAPKGAKAMCVNWDRREYVAVRGRWEAPQAEVQA